MNIEEYNRVLEKQWAIDHNIEKTYKPGVTVGFKVLKEGCSPERVTEGDVGYDLRASSRARLNVGDKVVVPLGVCLDMPSGYYAELTHRSSLAFKKGCICSLGIIDSNFKGELKACLFNLSGSYQWIDEGERICQLVFKKVTPTFLFEVEDTGKGKEGFGSSGQM